MDVDVILPPPARNALAARLSGDALVEIARRLSSAEIGALVLCGDRMLNNKFAHHIRTLTHRYNGRYFTWPFYTRGWTALRHLKVKVGPSFDIQHLLYEQTIELMTYVLDALPPRLESLNLTDWPWLLQYAARVAWQRRVELSIANHATRFTSDDDADELLDLMATTQPWIHLLQRFHLPHLREFSYALPLNLRDSKHLRRSIGHADNWIHTHSSLTSLSLSGLELSHTDAPLCDAFRALPRTLTSLKLKNLDNHEHAKVYGNSFVFSAHNVTSKTMTSDDYAMQMAGALPPHLTHLTLDLSELSHMPAIGLAHLSDLSTLKFKMRNYTHSTNPLYHTVSTNVLAHLPASVTSLSLAGLRAINLADYMLSMPEDEQTLRHLSLKRIDFFHYEGNNVDDYLFLRTIVSHPKFRRLESLYVKLGIFSAPFPERNASNRAVYGEMKRMTCLRSVNSLFMQRLFCDFWKHVSPLSSPTAPIKIRDTDSFKRYRSMAIDENWLKLFAFNDSSSLSPLPHITVKRLTLDETLYLLLMLITISQLESKLDIGDMERYRGTFSVNHASVSALTTLFQSVKHLTINVSDHSSPDVAKIMKRWPGTLKTFILKNNTSISFADISLYTTAPCMRALRVIHIEPVIDTCHLNDWLRQLPETLESLRISCSTPSTEHDERCILAYIPPRLKSMNIQGGVVIGKRTMDAIPPSLTEVYWYILEGIECSTSDLCRWPWKAQHIHISTSINSRNRMPDHLHCKKTLETWWDTSMYLKSLHIDYSTTNGRRVEFERPTRKK